MHYTKHRGQKTRKILQHIYKIHVSPPTKIHISNKICPPTKMLDIAKIIIKKLDPRNIPSYIKYYSGKSVVIQCNNLKLL